jgi:hypothetical protein
LELACRLAIEETPFIQEIRNNVVTIFFASTPPPSVDTQERQSMQTVEYGC